MSDTILVAIITACATTIPQIIIAIINNRNRIKLKKFECFDEVRRKVIFDYLDSIGQCIGTILTANQLEDYQKSMNKLLLYFPDLDINLLNNIYKSLFIDNSSNKTTIIMPLIKELSKSIIEIK